MQTKRQLQARQTREKLLQTAERLIMEKGTENVTIRDIASECGIALGTLYHYFASKEDLVNYINQKRFEIQFREIIDIISTDSVSPFSFQ